MSDELHLVHAKLTEDEKREQRREWFRSGWLLSGAPLEKCDAWFRAIDSQRALPHDALAPADYDDSEIALGKQRAEQLRRLEASERERAIQEDRNRTLDPAEDDLTGI